jgi:hypothetical protein
MTLGFINRLNLEMKWSGNKDYRTIWCISSQFIAYHKLTFLFQKDAMAYYNEVSVGKETPPRVHPLLLSLSEAWCASDTPDILSVCEDDPRVFESPYYVPPGELPSLGFYLGNGYLPNTNGV